MYNKVLRSPDVTGAAEVDPLAGASAGWAAPTFPVLAPDRLVEVEIVGASKGLVKDKEGAAQGRESLSLKIRTVKDYPDKDGKTLKAGFQGFIHISITPTEETDTKRARTWSNIGEDLAMVTKACGMGDRSPRELLNNPSMVLKSIAFVKTSIKPAAGGFPEGNNFKFVVPEK